jgi:hypothetical protein
LSLTTVSLTPCRNDTAGHASAGGGKTSCGTHRCPGSVSSVDRGALRLDAGTHTSPSVPQMFPLRPLP